MILRRPAALVIAVSLALAAQVTIAVPARAARELRAVTCCATHCGHAKLPTRAARCCQLTQDGGTTAVVSASPPAGVGPSAALYIPVASPSAPRSPTHRIGGHDRSLGRAGPVFLLTQSLLL